MGLIDFILNLAGMLLWLNWRSIRFDPLARTTPATLAGTLRRAEPPRMKRWHFLAALAALLLLRGLPIGRSARRWIGRRISTWMSLAGPYRSAAITGGSCCCSPG